MALAIAKAAIPVHFLAMVLMRHVDGISAGSGEAGMILAAMRGWEQQNKLKSQAKMRVETEG